MALLEIIAIGMNTEHSTDFIVDRKNGSGHWLLMCFSSAFEILTVNGLEQGEPGDCIIHDPSFPQYHCSVRNAHIGFVNSWFHCRGSFIRKLVEKYNLPLNTLIKTNQKFLFNKLLTEIGAESFKKLTYYDENIQLCFEMLLLEISRQRAVNNNNLLQMDKYRETLEQVRGLMMSEYAAGWSVEVLARHAKLSPARFALLYKKAFGISPIDDLIDIRLQEARAALLSTDKKIENIALECGFSSLYYFSRIFRKRVGISPSTFRK